jgi:hypothetical protein
VYHGGYLLVRRESGSSAGLLAGLPDTRASAISLVTAAIRGDVDTVRFALDMCDVDEFVPMFHASLALARALASRLRSPEGLMAVDVKLAEISRNHPSRDVRLAAQLILGHGQTCYPPVETVTAAETFDHLYSIGADTFNAACRAADYGIIDVFVAALAMWRLLLPEADIDARASMVCNVAGQLWASAEHHRNRRWRSPARPKLPAARQHAPTLRRVSRYHLGA